MTRHAVCCMGQLAIQPKNVGTTEDSVASLICVTMTRHLGGQEGEGTLKQTVMIREGQQTGMIQVTISEYLLNLVRRALIE